MAQPRSAVTRQRGIISLDGAWFAGWVCTGKIGRFHSRHMLSNEQKKPGFFMRLAYRRRQGKNIKSGL